MPQKPFNEPSLWKGQIQIHNPHSFLKRKIVSEKCSPLTEFTPSRPSVSEEIQYRYSLYSKNYWEQVKKRQEQYRINQLS